MAMASGRQGDVHSLSIWCVVGINTRAWNVPDALCDLSGCLELTLADGEMPEFPPGGRDARSGAGVGRL